MFAIIGIVVVFGCIVAGYLMEHGNLQVLLQPAELVIIGGAALGTVLVANPLHIIKKIVGGIGGVFGGSKFGKQTYIDTLKMMYDLLNKARKDGLMALEADVEEPEKSPVFSKNPAFLKNHHVCDFVCDSLRMAITGVDAFDLDQMLDLDLEVHHHDATATDRGPEHHGRFPSRTRHCGRRARRGHHDGRSRRPSGRNRTQSRRRAGRNFSWHPAVLRIGRPIAANMTKAAEEEHAFLYVMRVLMVSFLKGTAPIMAVEVARRAVPGHVRPSFKELEQACRAEERRPPPRPQPRLHKLQFANRLWTRHAPSSSSRKKAATAAITAAHGKSLTPISSPR